MSLRLLEEQSQGSPDIRKRKRMDVVPSATWPTAAECAQERVTLILTLHTQDPERGMRHGNAKL